VILAIILTVVRVYNIKQFVGAGSVVIIVSINNTFINLRWLVVTLYLRAWALVCLLITAVTVKH
jgi:hypothetical protein